MTTIGEYWRKKMLVQNIPKEWTQDMLQNFFEVVTEAELEQDGIEHFCGVAHTALLTFMELLTEQHVQGAQSKCYQEARELQVSLIESAPSMILCRDVTPAMTHDNLFYYFDHSRSGGLEGHVEECNVYPEYSLAVITFSSAKVAASVLARTIHKPSSTSTIQIEPCYEQFHVRILHDLKCCPISPEVCWSESALGIGNASCQSKSAVRNSESSVPPKHEVSCSDSSTIGDTTEAPSQCREFHQVLQPDQYTNTHALYGKKASYKYRGHRSRQKRNARNANNSQNNGYHGVKDDDFHPENTGGNENKHSVKECTRGRGRSSYRRNYQRGRGKDFRSHSQESKLDSFSAGHVTSALQSSLFCPIKLDADCNPISQESVSATEKDLHKCRSQDRLHEAKESGNDSSQFSDVPLEDQNPLPRKPHYSGHKQESAKGGTKYIQHAEPLKANKDLVMKRNSETSAKNTSSRPPDTRCWPEKTKSGPVSHETLKMSEKEQEAERLRYKLLEAEIQELLAKEKERDLEQQELKLEQQKAIEAKIEAEQKLQNLIKEKEELQKRKKEVMHFPAYKLQLMKEYAKLCSICEIIIHEKEETVQFCGTEEDFHIVKSAFLLQLQEIEEESFSVSATVTSILKTEAGQHYLRQMSADYAFCSFDVQDSSVVCAAYGMDQVKKCIALLKKNVLQKTLKVSKIQWRELQTVKQELEDDFPLARVTLSSCNDDHLVMIHGINGDFELMLRKLKEHCCRNQTCQGTFKITEPLEVRACRLWHMETLDSVKAIISKTYGEWKILDNPQQTSFQLTYQCHKEVLQEVQQSLDVITKGIKLSRIFLQSEFQAYSEYALVVNGLHSMGTELFCRLLEEKLKKDSGWESIIKLSLPPKCKLPRLEYSPIRRYAQGARQQRFRPVAEVQPKTRQHPHRKTQAMRDFKTNIGNCSLIIKSGDISSEMVDGIVCVVGEDLDLKQTAVGQAILKKYPQCVPASQQQRGAAGLVVHRDIPQSRLALTSTTAKDLYLAVLTKWKLQELQTHVMTVVQQCLQNAARRNKSLAFPPLGVGRKFQFPIEVVAKAMVDTVCQFFKGNSTTVLQSVAFIIYDVDAARQFRDLAKRVIYPPLPADLSFMQQPTCSTSDDDDDDGGGGETGDLDFGEKFFISPFSSMTELPEYLQNSVVENDKESVTTENNGGDDDQQIFFHLEDRVPDHADFGMAAANISAIEAPPIKLEALFCIRNEQSGQYVEKALLRELRSTFVHEDIFSDTKTLKKLSPRCIEEIRTAALEKGVVLKIQKRGMQEVLLVRGQQIGVTKMVAMIKDQLHLYLQKVHKKHSQAGHIPSASRGTQPPTYWKIQRDGIFKTFELWIREHKKYGKLYDVSKEEKSAISTLIHQTWKQNFVGHGKDAVNLCHQGIEVIKVERLENPNLWEEYCILRERMLRRTQDFPGKAFQPVEKVKNSTGPVMTSSAISRHNPLSREICPQVNEHYLFHGTKKEYIQAIHDQGLDTRIANVKAMLGRGVYASESSTKADQYTDDKTKRTGGHKIMLLMRVILGEPFINQKVNPDKFSRPPCKQCNKDKCSCTNAEYYDSVIDDAGRNFREFVVYDRCQCYPEYLITYQRV